MKKAVLLSIGLLTIMLLSSCCILSARALNSNEWSSTYAFDKTSSYQFMTGLQITSITLLPAAGSIPLNAANYFEVSYTLDGQPEVAYAINGTLTLTADPDTNVGINAMSSGSSGGEEWVMGLTSELLGAYIEYFPVSVDVPAGSTTTIYYYDVLVQPATCLISGGSGTSPILTYYTAPSGASSQSNPTYTAMSLPVNMMKSQSIEALRGTTASVTNNILGTAQDRWATPISSWNISRAGQIPGPIIYYHQYQVNATYATSDNSIPSTAPLLSGTQFGSNYQLPLSATSQVTWLDENTPWSISTIVTAPSGTEQWVVTGVTSGSVSGAITIAPMYYHQFEVSASYSTSDTTTPSASVTLTGASLGAGSSTTLSTTPVGVWLDAGSSWSINNPIIAGSETEQWAAAASGAAGAVTGAITIDPSYYDQYQVTFVVSPSGTGSTSPVGTNVWENAGSLSITATPNADYTFSSWSSNTGSITFTNANSAYTTATIGGTGTITATFAINTYTITVTQGTNGVIAPGTSTLNYGATPTFTITPTTGYFIASITANGASVAVTSPAGQSYQFSAISAAGSLTATFAINTYTISVTQTANGAIVPGTTTVNYGGSQTFTITPNTGYYIASLTVDGSAVTVASSYTFSNVQAAHTITATFAINTYTITVTQTANGQISPGTTAVNYGGSQSFTITPNSGYYIASITTDAGSVTVTSPSGQTVSFNNVQAAHTITATFALTPSSTPIPSSTATPITTPTSSPTQTPASSPSPSISPTPTIPEFSSFAVAVFLILLIAVSIALITVRKRKIPSTFKG